MMEGSDNAGDSTAAYYGTNGNSSATTTTTHRNPRPVVVPPVVVPSMSSAIPPPHSYAAPPPPSSSQPSSGSEPPLTPEQRAAESMLSPSCRFVIFLFPILVATASLTHDFLALLFPVILLSYFKSIPKSIARFNIGWTRVRSISYPVGLGLWYCWPSFFYGSISYRDISLSRTDWVSSC